MKETESNPPQQATENGATVVITHRVRDGKLRDYERWLEEIGPLCRTSPGHLDWQILRPIPGLTGTYTVVIRFDSNENLRDWMHSDHRKQLIEKVRPLLAIDDIYNIRSGLDFWFTPEAGSMKVPVRWKQFLITWSAIYPLVLFTPLLVIPAMRLLRLPDYRLLNALLVTGTIVWLMVYVVMPRYTKLVRRWLFA